MLEPFPIAMERRLAELETRLEELARELRRTEERLGRLETRLVAGSGVPSASSAEGRGGAGTADADLAPPALPQGVVPLIGRTLMVLGGAYLLRAVTDAGLLPSRGAVAIGLAYAALWLVVADAAAGAGRRTSAVFHGFAAAMIAYPLVWETTSRFGLLPPPVSAAALLMFLALGLALAWRRGLGEIAWMHGLFALVTAIGLLVATRGLVDFTIALLGMAAAVEALAFRDRWLGLRWPVALGLDLAVLELVLVAVRPGGPPEGYPALASTGVVLVSLALAVLYLGGTAARTLRQGRPVTPFELVQAPVALLLGLGGAARMMAFAGMRPTILGVFGGLLGIGCYAVAFAFLERRPDQGRNFYAYTTLGGTLSLVGSRMVLRDAALALVWSTLGLAAVWLGRRFGRTTLKLHGALYLIAAAVVAGLVAAASDGLLADPGRTWPPPTPIGLGAALAAAAAYALLVRARGRSALPRSGLLPPALVALLLAWSVAGLAARELAGHLAAAPGPSADPAFLAVTRTGVLAALAVGLAWAATRWSLRELIWLVYPLLAATGVKVLTEDLRHGRPMTLFLTLALYGGALVAAPRLMKSG